MATPIESSAAILVGAPALAVLFTFWPFTISFAAACIALIYVSITSINEALKNIVGSTLLGGALSQLTAIPVLAIAKSLRPELLTWAETAQMPMTAILAIIIGLLTQRLMPNILARLAKLVDGQ